MSVTNGITISFFVSGYGRKNGVVYMELSSPVILYIESRDCVHTLVVSRIHFTSTL